jgi:endonuclease/exonuclease/phosphatase family metal-dependent hydrolase
MKLVSFNIQYGVGRDGAVNLDRTAEAVRGADVIALQEVERHWRRTDLADQPQELSKRLPDHYWVFGANLDMDASYRGQDGRLVNRRKQFGTMVLSKTPIAMSRNFPLPKHGALAQHSIQQGLLEAVVETAAGPLRVYSVHLSHLSDHTRLPQVETVLDVHRRAFSEGGAWCGGHPDPDSGWIEEHEPAMPRSAVILGDMNFTHDSAEYARFVGPPSKYGRLNRRDGFVDAWVAAGHGEDQGVTSPVKKRSSGPSPDRRIDYGFVTADLAPAVSSAWIDEACEASDHQPFWFELDLERLAAAAESPRVSGADPPLR